MKLILEAIKAMFRKIEANRTHYDDRRTIHTPSVTVAGTTVEWGYVKVADNVDFDANAITSMTRRGSDGHSLKDVPVSIVKASRNALDIVTYTPQWNDYVWGVYFPTQEDADAWFGEQDGIINPFTPGLYMWVDILDWDTYPDGIGAPVEVTYSFGFATGELKKLDEKYLPDGVSSKAINNAQTTADNAQTTADNAQTTADNAQTTADNAQITADNNAEKMLELIDIDNIAISKGRSFSIAYGNGKFVAVASNGGSNIRTNAAAYSEDGITWIQTTMPQTAYWSRVLYGNGKFLTFPSEYGTTLSYSEDGITWNKTTLPSQKVWKQIAYGNGKFVVVGSGYTGSKTNVAAYSEDGIIWNQTTLPCDGRWNSIAYGNGKFVAIDGTAAYDNDGTAAYSEDGITWIQTTIPIIYRANVVYGNGKFVIMGLTSLPDGQTCVAYSEDGITWIQTELSTLNSYGDVTYCGDKFIAECTGIQNDIIYSEDGTTWIETSFPYLMFDIAYGNGKFVASRTSTNRIYYSEDFVTWNNSCHAIMQGNEDITNEVRDLILPIPSTAQVGQLLSVKAVDENGKPTEWEAVDPWVIQSSTADSTKKFRLIIGDDGVLTATEIVETTTT